MSDHTTQMVELAREVDILEAAQRLGAELKRHGHEHVGHCPAGCTKNGDGFSVNMRKRVFMCRPSAAGGDVINLVEHIRGLDFKGAVAFLCSEDWPEPVKRERHDTEAADKAHRDKQIRIARGIWERGLPFAGSRAEVYLAARGIEHLPDDVPLRFSPDQPYWRGEDFGKDDARPIWIGPAMLAAVTCPIALSRSALLESDGDPAPEQELVGCHITWINPSRRGEKARLFDPDSGEILPAKKLRGSKRKAAIKLIDRPGASRLVIGEGIETVLSAYVAERVGVKAAASSYWSAIDLGHMGGKPAESVEHPSLVNEKTGKPLRIGGPWPEAQPERDLIIPDEITEIVLLGDGDSDRFATEMTLRRAAARWERSGRTIKIAWAPPGQDFNDMLRGEANAR